MPMRASKTFLRVPYGLAVHNREEEKKILQLLRAKKTIIGSETKKFEEKIARLYAKKYGIAVNSGSSANFLAIKILGLPKGSEIVTPTLTFSTTVAPILQNDLIPVFVDIEPEKYLINLDHIEKAITKKTKALMIPLLLGNVPNMKRLRKIAKKYRLYLIEDSCDTLGAVYNGKPTGFYSDISTTSFYGSHIITAAGNGGMIMVNNNNWANKLRVLRGWGRNSSLFDDSEDISKRFKIRLSEIPYDAKFIFSEIGYNFLPSEIGSVFGIVQLTKLSLFRRIRKYNFSVLYRFFKQYEKYFVLPIQDKNVRTQWLAFPLTIKKGSSFNRLQIVTYLEKNNIQTRPIFTGNILRQPGFKHILQKEKNLNFPFTDFVMKNGFVIGCHHGLQKKHLEKIMSVFTSFLKRFY